MPILSYKPCVSAGKTCRKQTQICGKDGLHCFLKSVLIFNVDFIAQVGGKGGMEGGQNW